MRDTARTSAQHSPRSRTRSRIVQCRSDRGPSPLGTADGQRDSLGMVAHLSKAPARSDENLPMTPPPVALTFGSFLIPVGAGLGCLFAVLVLAAFVDGDDHAAAVFAAIVVLAAISSVVGVLLVAFGSILWDVRLVRHHGVFQELPKLLARGLIAWVGAIITGIAIPAGRSLFPALGDTLVAGSFGLWFAGALLLSIGSYRLRTPCRPRSS
jgi:hypothetical protein